MTREEAVAVLKAFMENPLFSDVHKAAFNIAIHDIKQRHDWDINNLILINKDNYEPITKNDLGVDCISRDRAIKALDYDIKSFEFKPGVSKHMDNIAKLLNTIYETQVNNIRALPPVTPQEPQEPQTFEWCDTCKEYDQENHCCHRWSKVIRDTVEAMKQEQEPILDKLRAEIEKLQKMCDKNDLNLMAQYSAFGMVLDILDKYTAESAHDVAQEIVKNNGVVDL